MNYICNRIKILCKYFNVLCKYSITTLSFLVSTQILKFLLKKFLKPRMHVNKISEYSRILAVKFFLFSFNLTI